MTDSLVSLFRHTFGEQLEESTLARLCANAKLRTYSPGAILVRQGEAGKTFFILAEGEVVVSQKLDDGEERLLSIMGAGDCFGELALIDNLPRIATCTAKTPATVAEISERVFEQLVFDSPAVAYVIMRRILSSMRSIDALAIYDLRHKNEKLQRAYAELQAAQAALIEKERLEHELKIAANMQRTLLPESLPQLPGYRFAAFLEPARDVGGDLYDVIILDDENIGLLVADVADKGMQAALFMGVTRTLFRREARQSLSPAAVALAVHRGLLDVIATQEMFVTAFYGVLHWPSGRLTYVRAAQERPFLARPQQPAQPLAGDGRFLGMIADLNLDEQTIQLTHGDRLLIFSDGISDAMNAQSDRFGIERLAQSFQQASGQTAVAIVDNILDDVRQWTAGAPPFDDLTLLAVEVEGPQV